MEISAMASSTTPRPSLPTPSPYPVVTTFTKHQPRRNHIALPTSSAISLLALFAPPNEAKVVVSIAKDHIVEKTIDKVQEVGSSVLDTTQRVVEVIGNALKPGIETALSIVQQVGEEVLKIASPAIFEASKKAQSFMEEEFLEDEFGRRCFEVETTMMSFRPLVG
ncbi:calcium sensing receptor, chloroplastic-like [Vigna radiata var. radiata]|uniref:Calcium sensing receptor, chloroplastic-like n=1 Tax=Vigna radiata var. radiata TaxID=3916 RepID=A0A1S3VGV9_VIGRR|nr:calcium sensing receptor, chloroplastic-like [Vigna radiata var. radiata]